MAFRCVLQLPIVTIMCCFCGMSHNVNASEMLLKVSPEEEYRHPLQVPYSLVLRLKLFSSQQKIPCNRQCFMIVEGSQRFRPYERTLPGAGLTRLFQGVRHYGR
jgi:hypothetical protein